MDILLESVNVLSVFGVAALVILTTKPCRASGVSYMLAIPAGFGLMTVAFVIQSVAPLVAEFLPQLASPVEAVSLLTLSYGVLFIAFVYARRTRLRLFGESTSIDLLVAALVTLVFLVVTVLPSTYGIATPATLNGEFLLRGIIVAASLYLVYETFRNWALTQKASQGIVTVGFAFFIVEQVGFILSMLNLKCLFPAAKMAALSLFIWNSLIRSALISSVKP